MSSVTTAGTLTEIQIGWGEDTRCTVCLCDLPATAPAWTDGDGTLCADCADAETPYPAAERQWVREAVLMAAAEILAEEPTASPARRSER